MAVAISGHDLTLDEVLRVARQREKVELTTAARDAMARARTAVETVIGDGGRAYGVTTGVGVRRSVSAWGHDWLVLRQHLTPHPPIASHEVARAATVRLINALASGTTAVRPEIADRYVAALNADQLPELSVGGMIGIGDLSPLAQLAVGVLGDMPLAQGEMIGLINQSAVAVGLAALTIADAGPLLDTADIALALDFEALPANRSVLDPLVETARPYPGVQRSLSHVRRLLEGGKSRRSHFKTQRRFVARRWCMVLPEMRSHSPNASSALS